MLVLLPSSSSSHEKEEEEKEDDEADEDRDGHLRELRGSNDFSSQTLSQLSDGTML